MIPTKGVMCDCIIFISVSGNWGMWSVYGLCSSECGGGEQLRTRKCDNPPPAHGGPSCRGPSTDKRRCGMTPCAGKMAHSFAWKIFFE